MDFVQVEAEFQKLKGQYEAGALTEAEFKAELEKLMLQDEQDRWWMIGYETSQWYYHDGQTWVRADPPQVAARRREQVEALCQEGATALGAGDWGTATEKFEAALALEPGHPGATAYLAEVRAQAQQPRESEAKSVIATRPTGMLLRVPPWAYGRVAVLILLLLGFFGPWYIGPLFSGTIRITGWMAYGICLGSRGVLVLAPIAVAVLFFVTLLRLIWRPVRENRIAIWLERIPWGVPLITMVYVLQYFNSWGFWCTLAAVLLAPLNLILEHLINRARQQSASTDSSTDPP